MEYGYDLVIVGAGPAGLSTAINARKKGLRVGVFEKSNEIGYPVKTSAFTWKEVIDSWGLSEKTCLQEIDTFALNYIDENIYSEVSFEKPFGAILDYHLFLRELAIQAIETGSKFFLNENVHGPLIEKSQVVGVVTEKQTVKSRITIDCSGPNAIIARSLKRGPENDVIGVGFEYELANFKPRKQSSIDFYVGEKTIVPIGYGWVFPTGVSGARVGICTGLVENQMINLKSLLNKFLGSESPIYDHCIGAQPYEIHSGAYPLSGMVKKPFGHGFLAVGDSAAQASMMVGEGIRYALLFGQIAASVATDAVKRNDFSEKYLSQYHTKCLEQIGETYAVASDLLNVPTNQFWKSLANNIERVKDVEPTLVLDYLRTSLDYEKARKLFPDLEAYLTPSV